jgi:hypothetical protein
MRNPKSEYLNPKQIQMAEIQMFQTSSALVIGSFEFSICLGFSA